MVFRNTIHLVLVGVGLALCGCARPDDPEFQSSERVGKLAPELQKEIDKELTDKAGTYANPKLIGADHNGRLRLGQSVYQQRCVQCHGISGDGNGVVAKYMYPRPRDYRRGLFKFTSTPYGARPLREDLERTIRAGVRGTSMPDFKLLPKDQIDAVIEYVLMLTRRGEYEDSLAALVESEEVLDPELVKEESYPGVMQRWITAEAQQVSPLTPQPKFTAEHVEQGRQAFLTLGCSKCHGEDGRGQMAENIGKDAWGQSTRAADLTSGMLHGGQRPLDIYRRIYSGINGTPMPGFAQSLQSQPDTIWHLVAFVKSISNRRREGESPLPGTIKPYEVPVPAESSEAAVTSIP